MNEKAGFLKRIKLAVMQPKDTVVFRTASGVWDHKLNINVLQLPQYKHFRSLDVYANFSSMVYKNQLPGSESRNSEIPITTEWQQVLDQSDTDQLIKGKKSVDGLKYEAWYSAGEKQLVIAFRGTGKRLGDWFSNFRWFTRIIPGVQDHYDLLRLNIDGILERAKASCGEIDSIVTTGHSLGGGLAQHAAYSSSEIQSVYAFNPTPVTGYSGVEESERGVNTSNLFIARVFEHGEVLAYMRFGLRHFYKISLKNPEIVELRFNFSRKAGVIREHGMHDLAHAVGNIARQSTTVSDSWVQR